MRFSNLIFPLVTSLVHCLEYDKNPYIVVFGDGFSDIGNTDSSVSYTPTWFGRFSNGPVWNEYFSHDNNYTLISYAYGGSTLNSTFTSSLSGLSFNIPSFFDQFGIHCVDSELFFTSRKLQ
ncbi:hypothetical protein AYI69_g6337 [Smittium culicis]|uniref:Thermolabile hemolysin n=1 Tax=Smittium culicis TaxID=133412 RepID=A0A1R1XZK8_9FUNG|nr:hypothetical protein AYI69_g6337 [Smittium culicis]